jgi:hypothetical protein
MMRRSPNAGIAMRLPASSRVRALACAAVLSLLAGCHLELQREHPLGCPLDQQSLIRDTLYFGLGMPDGGTVDDAAWQRFAEQVLAPAFPDGFTVVRAEGRWRGATGSAKSEPSRLVIVLHEDDASSRAALERVADTYRRTFQQESVLRERSTACVAW